MRIYHKVFRQTTPTDQGWPEGNMIKGTVIRAVSLLPYQTDS